MSKITLNNVSNLASWTSAGSNIDANSAAIENAVENTLSRDGTAPNEMNADLDMNSNQILNLPYPLTLNSPLRLADTSGIVGPVGPQGPIGPPGPPGPSGPSGLSGSVDNVISAGVYDSTNNLIRTLWSNRPQEMTGDSWDGLKDDGTIAPAGTYTIKGLTGSVSYTWDGVIGNTNYSSVATATQDPRLFQSEGVMYSMAITPGGTMYFCTGYNEARVSTFKASVANPQAATYVNYKGWRSTGALTSLVATDSNIVYWAGINANDLTDTGIYGTLCSNDNEVAFTSSVPVTWSNGAVSYNVINHIQAANARITGLAVQQSLVGTKYLFATRSGLNTLTVMDKSATASPAVLQTITTITAPGACCVDTSDDHLWVIVGGTTAKKYLISTLAGGTATALVTITGLTAGLSIAVSPDNTKVAIVDGGNQQQVKFFDNTTGAPSGSSLGTLGGYATDPTVTTTKFMFNYPGGSLATVMEPNSFIAYDLVAADGSFWLGDPGNIRNLRFDSSHIYSTQIAWIPAFYSANLCQGDPTRLFAVYWEFKLDYTKPFSNDPSTGAWSLFRNWSYWGTVVSPRNIDLFVGFKTPTILGNGRTYCLARQLANPYTTRVYELDPTSSIPRDTGVVVADVAAWNIEANGTLTTINTGSQITWTTCAAPISFPSNNPVWGSPVITTTSPVLTSTDPKAFISDTITYAHLPTTGGVLPVYDGRVDNLAPVFGAAHGWHLGGVDMATNQWRFRTAPTTPPNFGLERSNTNLWPQDGYFDVRSVSADGPLLVSGEHIFCQYYGEGWLGVAAGSEVNKYRHYHESGLLVGEFGVVEDQRLNSATGAQSNANTQLGMAGNANRATCVLVGGTLYIFHNDEGFKSGVHRWRVTGLDTVKVIQIPVNNIITPPVNVNDMLAGLPLSASVPNNTAGWVRSPVNDSFVDPFARWWSVWTNSSVYNSPVYSSAAAYGGFQNKSPDISMLFISPGTDSPGQLHGGLGAVQTLSTWQAITNGSLTVTINGSTHNITGLDFSGCARLAQLFNGDTGAVAGVIQVALQADGATSSIFQWRGTTAIGTPLQKFILISGTTGVASTVGFLTAGVGGTDVSGMLAMLSGSAGAYTTAGATSGVNTASVTRTLPTVGTQGWELNMIVQVPTVPIDIASYSSIEVADASGKLITQFIVQPTAIVISDGLSSTQSLVSGTAQFVVNVAQLPNSLIIKYSPSLDPYAGDGNGKLTVTYAGTSVVVSPKDILANAALPGSLSVRFHEQAGGFNTSLQINLSQILFQ